MSIEDEVRHSLATDPHYPLGEPDAMKWAVAFRILMTEKHGALLAAPDRDGNNALSNLDGWMVSWFANCMATGEMHATGGSFLNADGVQSIIDGDIDPHPELCR